MSSVRGARCAPLIVRVAIVTTRSYACAARSLYRSALPSEFRLTYFLFHCTELCRFLPLHHRCRSSLRRFFCLLLLRFAFLSSRPCALHSGLLCIRLCFAFCAALVSASSPPFARRLRLQHSHFNSQNNTRHE